MECNSQKLTWEEEVSCIEAQLQTKRAAFAAVCESNLEWKQKVEDCKKKICERYSVKAKLVYEYV